MIDFFEDASEHISDIDGNVHSKLGRAPSPNDVGRWRREMSLVRQIQFEAVAGNSLRAMSYPCVFSRIAAPLGPLYRWLNETFEQA